MAQGPGWSVYIFLLSFGLGSLAILGRKFDFCKLANFCWVRRRVTPSKAEAEPGFWCTVVDGEGRVCFSSHPGGKGAQYKEFFCGAGSPVGERLSQAVEEGLKYRTEVKELYSCPSSGCTYRLTVSPLEDGQQRFWGVAALAVEVTGMGRIEAHLRNLERLHMMDELTAAAAHEIRNPLTAIRALAQLAQIVPDIQEKDRCFKQIIGEIDRLTQLLSELVNFSRPERHNFQFNDLRETMRGVITLVEGIAKKQGITIETDFEPQLPPVLYEPSLIKQAFLNLMTNAIEAMPSGGRVEVSIAFHPAAESVRVTIKDTGHGIPPELVPKVMAPFFTTKEYGTGLGLAVTRQIIVEGHGGRLWLESRVKEGTTVYVELPVSSTARRVELDALRDAAGETKSASCPTA